MSDFHDRQVESRHLIIGIGSVESSYLIQNVASLTDPDHPDFAVLLLYLQYFCQTEVSSQRLIHSALFISGVFPTYIIRRDLCGEN